MTKEERKEKLIQEAKEFAAAYFEDRNNCVGKEWVDNVTDSWIYDAEDFWMSEYKKKHKGKEPSRDEVHAHFVECRRLFDQQYAGLFGVRDAKDLVTGLLNDFLEKEKKTLESLERLSKNSDSRFVKDVFHFVQHMQFMDERVTRMIKRDIESGHFRGCGCGCGFGGFGF